MDPKGGSSDLTLPQTQETGVEDSSGAEPCIETTPSHATKLLENDGIIFSRRKKSGALYKQLLKDQHYLRNSLLAGVGYLELANAGDFAANVWNNIPVPMFAVALMAVGGTIALSISLFAFRDAVLSWRNIRNLRAERRYLHSLAVDTVDIPDRSLDQDHHSRTTTRLVSKIPRDIDAQLKVNSRELGTELIDRIGMDITMGFGAVAVGVGTFLAIGGANPQVFRASNLLSGYIGNAPVSFFGAVNAGWSAYVWQRARRHGRAGTRELNINDNVNYNYVDNNHSNETNTDLDANKDALQAVKAALKSRLRTVKVHAVVSSVTGITAGAASLVTATMWYGYPVLVLCIISSILTNCIWRYKIGYDRPLVRHRVRLSKDSLIQDLELVTTARRILDEARLEKLELMPLLPKFVSDAGSLAAVVEFLAKNDLLEDFYTRLLTSTALSEALFGSPSNNNDNEELVIEPLTLLGADEVYVPQCLEIAEATIQDKVAIRLKYRERYLLEALGCYLCSVSDEALVEKC
jgi:hypothetical protein